MTKLQNAVALNFFHLRGEHLKQLICCSARSIDG